MVIIWNRIYNFESISINKNGARKCYFNKRQSEKRNLKKNKNAWFIGFNTIEGLYLKKNSKS